MKNQKKVRMAKKDTSEKILLAHNDVFADVVNALLFKGEPRVKPAELSNAQLTSIFKADGKLRGQERDVAKFWRKQKIHIAFFGLENQTEIDRTMPLRIMGYDGSAYKAQLLGKERTQFYPVITLVLYLGYKRRWRKPRSLYEAIDISNELKPFTSDYKINVFEIAFLEKDAIMKFKSDFKILADYLHQMRTTKDYRPSSEEITHVEEVMQMMSAMTGDERFAETYNEQRAGGARRIKTMLEWLDKAISNGRKEGIAIGEKRGRTAGIAIGEERGREEGVAIGIAEGARENALATAQKLKVRNMPLSDIADITGLSFDEVAAL